MSSRRVDHPRQRGRDSNRADLCKDYWCGTYLYQEETTTSVFGELNIFSQVLPIGPLPTGT